MCEKVSQIPYFELDADDDESSDASDEGEEQYINDWTLGFRDADLQWFPGNLRPAAEVARVNKFSVLADTDSETSRSADDGDTAAGVGSAAPAAAAAALPSPAPNGCGMLDDDHACHHAPRVKGEVGEPHPQGDDEQREFEDASSLDCNAPPFSPSAEVGELGPQSQREYEDSSSLDRNAPPFLPSAEAPGGAPCFPIMVTGLATEQQVQMLWLQQQHIMNSLDRIASTLGIASASHSGSHLQADSLERGKLNVGGNGLLSQSPSSMPS